MGIDLGTANTAVCVGGQGIVLCEPSVVAVRKGTTQVLNNGNAVGNEAKDMLDKCPGNIEAIRPLKSGVISDFEITEAMLAYFIRKVHKRAWGLKPRLIISVPMGITSVEKRAVIESAERAGARSVFLIEQPKAAALGAGLPISDPQGSVIVDIGGGTTDIAVVALGGMVYDRSVRTAGHHMDEAIIQYMRRRHGLLIGERTAEQVKIEIGSASDSVEVMEMEVRGRCLREGRPRVVHVKDAEVREALAEPLKAIVFAVREALDAIPPEIAADISNNGIVVTGGGALLRGIDERLRQETGVPVAIADEPLTSVVRGVGRMLDDVALLKRVAAAA
jgi:rod shape-determining protein MreB